MTENQQIRQQIRQNNGIVLLLLVAFLCSFLHNMFPSSNETFKLFPLSGQGLTLQTYFYFLFQEVYKVILVYAVYLAAKIKVIKHFFFIDSALLIDYLMTYDSFVFDLFFIELSMVRIALILKTMLLINYLWAQSK